MTRAELLAARYKAEQAARVLTQSTPLLRLAVREMRARAKAAKRKKWKRVVRKRAKLRALLDAAKRLTA